MFAEATFFPPTTGEDVRPALIFFVVRPHFARGRADFVLGVDASRSPIWSSYFPVPYLLLGSNLELIVTDLNGSRRSPGSTLNALF